MEVPAALVSANPAAAALDPATAAAAAAWLPRAAPPAGLSAPGVDGGGWQEGVAAAAGRHYRACLTCRQAKIKCCGRFPCSRCFRLSQPCRPQFWRKDPYAGLRGTELVFKTVDPRGFAALYIEGFYKVFREGRVDRPRAVHMMRTWAGMSSIIQHDITFGLLAAMARALHVSPLELEGPDSIRHSPHPDARRAFLTQIQSQLAAANIALQQSDIFKAHDPGDDTAIFMASLVPGRAAHASNAAFDRLFRRASEITGDVMERKCLPALLFAGVISPDDRALWLHCLAELLFVKELGVGEPGGDWTRRSHFLKVFDRDGDIRIYIYTIKLLCPRPGQTIIVHQLEPAPPSRHLTDRPDNHKVMKTFRQVRPLERAAAGASTEEGGGAGPPGSPSDGAMGAAQLMVGGSRGSCGSAASSTGSTSGDDGPGWQGRIPGLVCFPLSQADGNGGRGSPKALREGPRQQRLLLPSAADPVAPPVLKKEERSGSSDSSGSGPGGATDREEDDRETERKAEALFALEATRQKRKMGQALVVDPTTQHLELTLREMLVGGVGDPATTSGGAWGEMAGDIAPAPSAAGAGPSRGGSSRGGRSSPVSSSSVAGAGGNESGKMTVGHPAPSPSPLPLVPLPPPSLGDEEGHEGWGRQPEEDQGQGDVGVGGMRETSQGVREDEAMLLLSLRMGGR